MPGDKASEFPARIEKTKVILAEGADTYYFMFWAYQEFGASGIQVFDFRGVSNLRTYLKTFREIDGFANVESLIIARDAETDAGAALASVRAALADANLPAPAEAFTFADGKPRTAVMIFPGFDREGKDKQLANGMLEDLCLATVANDKLMQCVDDFLTCSTDVGEQLTHPKKSRLHAYLAGKNDFAGLKLGEATRAKAWNLAHKAVLPFKQLIQSM
ncbi:MAG: hypothetical protein KAY37_08340 [Phycisphaerae bacterium]|nr:hypothetical protein [Phycisphaerae bacterium]